MPYSANSRNIERPKNPIEEAPLNGFTSQHTPVLLHSDKRIGSESDDSL